MVTPKPTAVLVVHGIGQQMPMDTVRRFVRTVFGTRPDGRERPIFSKLDRDSDFLDLRRLVIPGGKRRGRVDFYEVYWAPALSGGSAPAVLAWAARLLFTRSQGDQLRRIVWAARCLLILLLLLAGGLYYVFRDSPWLRYLAPLAPLALGVWPLLRGWGSSVFSETLADASRWFAPRPRDIPDRDNVRRIGHQLLMELHRRDADGQQRYGRIVVFGHSLGSVIAYDIIRMAFDELRWPRDPTPEESARPVSERQPAAWNFSVESTALTETSDVGRFQHFQRQLHQEQRAQGVPWLVSDLVTVGSPLTHARDLWSSGVASFDQRIEENEFPACPPRGEFQHSEYRRLREGKQAIIGGDGPLAFYRVHERGPLVSPMSGTGGGTAVLPTPEPRPGMLAALPTPYA